MAKYLKNTSGATGTWEGQQIANGAYYELQNIEETKFAYSSSVITDLGSGDLKAARDNSGSNDISDVNEALNFLRSENPKDPDGASIIRPKAAKKGWTYHMHAIQFESCKLGSIVEKDHTDTATTYGTLKVYNSSDTELTTQGDCDTSGVKTVIDFEPDWDYEIIGGKVQNKTVPANSLRLYVVAVPDLTYAQGGSRVMINNIDVSYLDAKSEVDADGRASKYMTYDATYHTNKLRIIMYHSAGEKVQFQMIYEMYRA